MLYLRVASIFGALALVGCATAGESELSPDGSRVEADAQDITPNPDASVPVDGPRTPIDAPRPIDAALPPDAPADPGPAADTCVGVPDVTAVATSPSGYTATGTTAGFANDIEFDDTCTGYATLGPDAIVAVQLGFLQSVTATVTPTGAWDPAVEVVDACGASAACLAGIDDGLEGAAETVTHLAFLPGTVYVVVDGYAADASGAYTLRVQVQ